MSALKQEEIVPSLHRNALLPGKASPALKELDRLRKAYNIGEVEKLAAQGKKAIWSGLSWETPLIYACDTIPLGIGELWREESRLAEALGEEHYQIPPEFCSMIKAMLGRMHLRSPDPINRILYFGSVCEPIASIYEMIRAEGYDVYCIDNVTSFRPEDKRPEVIAFLVQELKNAILWLNNGEAFDEVKLWNEIKRKNAVLQKIRTILDLRLKAPLYLSSISTMQVVLGANHYFGQAERYLALLDQLINELSEAACTPVQHHLIPIVLAGGSLKLVELIEESQGVVVAWESVSAEDYRLDLPPLESIAHYLLDAQSRGELGEGAGTSASYRKFRIEEMISRTGARGVISSAITGCPYGSVTQIIEREYFHEQGIPITTLEASVHNERPGEEQIMRVKAFFEMLSHP